LFLAGAEAEGHDVAVVDVPLLFEVGADAEVDAVVVVTAPAAVQRERVLARAGMDEARLAAILARQVPDEEKRARADFVIDTSYGLEHARSAVHTILQAVRGPDFRSRRRTLD
jgi:dephospho-CoA kinase